MAWSKITFYYEHRLSGLTATTADPEYPVENLLNTLEGEIWKGTSIADHNIVFDAALLDPEELGIVWKTRTSAADNDWLSVAYGNGLFVAVAASGTGNRVMTSPDGITWKIRTSAADNNWRSVAYGNGLFVAVASSGTGNRVMTSADGITWTIRTSAADNWWNSVTYGNGLFVAVAASGTGNRVMTSPDGITWTIRTSAADNFWSDVAYGDGLFVAVAYSGTGNLVMTSPDGITWTIRTSAADNNWRSVAYGNGLFVAVASTGIGNRVMTSPNGIDWTIQTSAAGNDWRSVMYGEGLFVAVATTGTDNRVMTSPDGIDWTIRTSAADNNWYGVAYGGGLFVAVAASGTSNRVMTSSNTITCDYLAMNGGNLSGATIALQFSDDNFSADIREAFIAFAKADNKSLVKEFTSISGRYSRLKITSLTSNPFLSIAHWGLKTELDYATASFDPNAEDHKANVNVSQTGYLLGINLLYVERSMQIRISDADATLYYKYVAWRDFVGLNNFFVAWEPTSHPGEVYLMRHDPRFFAPLVRGGLYRDLTFNLRGRKIS